MKPIIFESVVDFLEWTLQDIDWISQEEQQQQPKSEEQSFSE